MPLSSSAASFCVLLLPFFARAYSFGAFCKKDAGVIDRYSRAHPSDVPTDVNSPWVWEAVYRDVSTSGVLQVTVVPRWACNFNEQAWLDAFAMLPQHSAQLADGRRENIIVPTLDYTSRQDIVRLISDVEWRFQEARRKKGGKSKNVNGNVSVEDTAEMRALRVELASLEDKRLFAMIGERLGCLYYTLSPFFELLLVASSVSEPIQGRHTWMAAGSVEVFCPVPPGATFEYVRLNRTLWGNTIVSETFIYCRESELLPELAVVPAPDPLPGAARVAGVGKPRRPLAAPPAATATATATATSTGGRPPPPVYTLAMCTASSRADRLQVVEWLEYHRLVGVEHVFFYNTAPGELQHLVYNTMSDYIAEGYVTEVNWPYESCVHGMASGRAVSYIDRIKHQRQYFQPPGCVALVAALSSCYSRYRGATRYMLMIDDDEFVALAPPSTSLSLPLAASPPAGAEEDGGAEGAARRARRRRKRRARTGRPESLAAYATRTFAAHPGASTIKFYPVAKYNCHDAGGDTPGDSGGDAGSKGGGDGPALPRVGRWRVGSLYAVWEGKHLVRTDRVRNVVVHYIAQLEPAFESTYGKHQLMANGTDAVLLHYKYPPELSGDIWGTIDADTAEPGTKNESQLCGIYRDHRALRAQHRRSPDKLIAYRDRDRLSTARLTGPAALLAEGRADAPYEQSLSGDGTIIRAIHPALAEALRRRFRARIGTDGIQGT